jgi:hypothetical protein
MLLEILNFAISTIKFQALSNGEHFLSLLELPHANILILHTGNSNFSPSKLKNKNTTFPVRIV